MRSTPSKWVNRRSGPTSAAGLFRAQERTYLGRRARSASCHNRTHALRPKDVTSITSSASRWRCDGHHDAQGLGGPVIDNKPVKTALVKLPGADSHAPAPSRYGRFQKFWILRANYRELRWKYTRGEFQSTLTPRNLWSRYFAQPWRRPNSN